MVEQLTDPPPRPIPPPDPVIQPPRRVPNARRTFWVADGATGGLRQVTARLRVQTDHAALWVEQGLWHDVRTLEAAAEHFQKGVYSPTRAIFGSEWSPGIDGDPRIQILHIVGAGDGVQGYASTRDEYPISVNPRSNQAELIVVNTDKLEVGSPSYQALLAREFTRLILWHQDRNETSWVREGLVELGAALAGADTETIEAAYARQPDVGLAHWENTDAQRGASYLLMTYLRQRFGDDAVRALSAEPANGAAGFNAALETLDSELSFDRLFADWLGATYLMSVGERDAVLSGYAEHDLPPLDFSSVYTTYPVTSATSVNQLGADALLLRGGEDLTVTFEGTMETPLFTETVAVDGLAWWSHRAAESLSVLTRTVNLEDVEEAALTYRAWYDIERDYDYVALELSADDGASWQVLRTPSGTGSDPHGNNPGWGYTGRSGGWFEEEVDLSDHAGEIIQVRFSYLTDAALTGEGFVLDEIVVRRGGEGNEDMADLSGWHSQGFVLTDGAVPQTYIARLVTLGNTVETEILSFDLHNAAEWAVPLGRDDVDEAVLILSAHSPLTRQPADYRLHIRTAGSEGQSDADKQTN